MVGAGDSDCNAKSGSSRPASPAQIRDNTWEVLRLVEERKVNNCGSCSKRIRTLCRRYLAEKRLTDPRSIWMIELELQSGCVLELLKKDKRYRGFHPREARLFDEAERKRKQPISQMKPQERRRAIAKKLLSTLSEKQWDFIKHAFNDKCCYCGRKRKLTKDHFVALSNGGAETHRNILPACRQCNSSKNNKDALLWFKKQEFYSVRREEKIRWMLNYGK